VSGETGVDTVTTTHVVLGRQKFVMQPRKASAPELGPWAAEKAIEQRRSLPQRRMSAFGT
jgi:hypothetical protein